MVTLPKMEMISTDSSWISELPQIMRQNREREEFEGALAGLQSNDPGSIDAAIRKLAKAGPAGAALATRLINSQQEAKQHEENLAVRKGALGVSQGRLGLAQTEAKRREDFLKSLMQGGEAAPAAVPGTAPAAPAKYPLLDEADEDEPETEGVDVSSQARMPPAGQPAGQGVDFTKMTPQQLFQIQATAPDAGIRQAAALRLRQLQQAGRAEAKLDPRTEAIEKGEGKAFVEQLNEVRKNALSADRQKALLDAQERELQNIHTGFGGGAVQAVNRGVAGVADFLGKGYSGPQGTGAGRLVDSARQQARAGEIIQANTSNLLYEKLQGFGKGTTNEERAEMRNIYAAVEKTKEGNLALIQQQKRLADIQKEEMAEVIKYRKHQAETGQKVSADDVAKIREKVQARGQKKLKEFAAKDAEKFGVDTWLGGKPPQEAGSAAAASKAAPTLPERPPGVPPEAGWSPSRKGWYTRDGKRWEGT